MRTTAIAVLCILAAGCTQTDVNRLHSLKCAAPVAEELSPVVVSGPFAVARSFEVGPEGIPITDIVDQSLRPGYRALGALPQVVQQTAAESDVPTLQVPASLKENVRGWARETIADDAEAAGERVKRQLKALGVEGMAADAQFDQLEQDFGELPPSVPRGKIDEFWQAFKKAFTLREEGDPAPAVAPSVAPQATAAQVAMNSARVVINRATGSRLIVPVQSVMYTSAGDIRVLPGESVVITEAGRLPRALHQERSDRNHRAMVVYSTANGRPSALDVNGQDAQQTLATVYDKAGRAMVGPEDCVRVSRLAADGVAETYILPILDRQAQTKSSVLHDFNVADGDMIRFDVLDRTPDVLRSRELLNRIDSEAVKTLHDVAEDRLSSITGGRSDVIANAKRRIRGRVGRFGRRMQSLAPRF